MTKWMFHSGPAIFIGLSLLTACKAKPDPEARPESHADSVKATDTLLAAPIEPALTADPAAAPDFQGLGLRARINRYCEAMGILSNRFADKAFVQEKDSSPNAFACDSTRPAADSILKQWLAFQDSADGLIHAYTMELASGIGDKANRPAMLKGGSVADSLSLAKLPKVQPSSFLMENSFFFLGAGPFLDLVPPDEDGTEADVDLQGESELRFCNEFSGNTQWIMDMIRGFAQAPAITQDGPSIPLGHSEEVCALDKSVKGTGSLLHAMSRNLPAYFITEKGLVTARLAQVTDKLFPSQLGCSSSLPKVCFGVPNFPEGEILGVFIPYEPITLSHCKVTRTPQVWTVDLTGDDVPEMAGVTSSREGLSDTINKVIWYGNVSGSWIPLDSGEDPECT